MESSPVKCWCVDKGESVQKLDGAVGMRCVRSPGQCRSGELQVRARGELGGGLSRQCRRGRSPSPQTEGGAQDSAGIWGYQQWPLFSL